MYVGPHACRSVDRGSSITWAWAINACLTAWARASACLWRIRPVPSWVTGHPRPCVKQAACAWCVWACIHGSGLMGHALACTWARVGPIAGPHGPVAPVTSSYPCFSYFELLLCVSPPSRLLLGYFWARWTLFLVADPILGFIWIECRGDLLNNSYF